MNTYEKVLFNAFHCRLYIGCGPHVEKATYFWSSLAFYCSKNFSLSKKWKGTSHFLTEGALETRMANDEEIYMSPVVPNPSPLASVIHHNDP